MRKGQAKLNVKYFELQRKQLFLSDIRLRQTCSQILCNIELLFTKFERTSTENGIHLIIFHYVLVVLCVCVCMYVDYYKVRISFHKLHWISLSNKMNTRTNNDWSNFTKQQFVLLQLPLILYVKSNYEVEKYDFSIKLVHKCGHYLAFSTEFRFFAGFEGIIPAFLFICFIQSWFVHIWSLIYCSTDGMKVSSSWKKNR